MHQSRCGKSSGLMMIACASLLSCTTPSEKNSPAYDPMSMTKGFFSSVTFW